MDEMTVVASFRVKLEPDESLDDAIARFERILFDSGLPVEELKDIRLC